MLDLIILFAAVFVLNIIPAFAPPTWMALSYVGFRHSLHNTVLLALVGAAAATLGRITLAKLSRVIVRQKLLSESARENVDAIKQALEKKRKLTFSVCLVYALGPLPSNYLFIAYGLTSLPWNLIAIPFFLGRFVGYNFWVFAGSAAAKKIALESAETPSYLGLYFILSQSILLSLVYLVTKIDWKAFFSEKKVKWIKASHADRASRKRENFLSATSAGSERP